MKRHAPLVLSLVVLACGGTPTPDASSPEYRKVGEIPAAPPPGPPKRAVRQHQPTPEEKKSAEAMQSLEKDRAKMKADHEAELKRWTPELHSEAKTLADKTFPSGKAAITAMLTSKHRRPGHADRDKFRHPVETLEFFGFKPTMTVLEYGPGEGWYTELLAPAVAKQGKLLATSADPNGPANERSTYYGERFKLLLDSSPEVYGKVETVIVGSPPKIDHEGKVDLALVIRGMHGMVNSKSVDAWLSEIHAALKPTGVLGIVQHRAKPDAKPEESAKKGYLPEKWVIETVEAAGFKLAGKSEVNANPKDTKDYADGVWALPPTLQGGDTDKAKYQAIGESDRMTLKFVKVAKKAEPAKKPEPAK